MKTKQKNKLRYYNDWGYHLYSVGKTNIRKLQEVCIGKKKYKVKGRTDTESIYDMGHTYDVSSTKYYVPVKFFGVTIDLDLCELLRKNVDVIVTKFVPEEK